MAPEIAQRRTAPCCSLPPAAGSLPRPPVRWGLLIRTLALLLFLSGCQFPRLSTQPGPTASTAARPSASEEPDGPTSGPVAQGAPDLSAFSATLRPEFSADLPAIGAATRYDLDLQFDLAAMRIRGQETIRYTNREQVPLDTLYFRLFPNHPACSSWAIIKAVQARGQSLTPLYDARIAAARVLMIPPLEVGEQITLKLVFEVKIPVDDRCRYRDLNYSDGVAALAHFYPQIPVYDDEGWNVEPPPTHGDMVYADASLYHVTATLPSRWVVAACGTEVARSAGKDDTVTVSWVAGPARDFAMALSQDYLTLTQNIEGVQVTSFFLAGHEAAGKKALEYAARALQVFQARFGPYRYRELDVAETSTSAGGIEYPGLIVLNSYFYTHDDPNFETVVAHEVSHQWWYSLIGNDQVDEAWLDEGLASYSSVIYYQETDQKERSESLLTYYRENYQRVVDQGLDAPANLSVESYSVELYGPLVYSKSALFFDALRQEVGDQAFWRLLEQCYQRFLYGIVTGEELLSLAEEVSGKDLGALFEAWILSPTTHNAAE